MLFKKCANREQYGVVVDDAIFNAKRWIFFPGNIPQPPEIPLKFRPKMFLHNWIKSAYPSRDVRQTLTSFNAFQFFKSGFCLFGKLGLRGKYQNNAEEKRGVGHRQFLPSDDNTGFD